MSIIVLPKPLTEHTTAKAADVMADLNKILELVNGGLDSANLAAGGVATANLGDGAATSRKLKPTAGEKSHNVGAPGKGVAVDVPETELAVAPAVNSLLLVTAVFQGSSGALGQVGRGYVFVDGALFGGGCPVGSEGVNTGLEPSTAIAYAIPLAAGNHTVKLRWEGNMGLFKGRYTYLLVGV